jgi:hypothetical protein
VCIRNCALLGDIPWLGMSWYNEKYYSELRRDKASEKEKKEKSQTIHLQHWTFQPNINILLILVNNQLDAQFFFLICSLQFSTCFKQHRAHHQENQLYQYNVWCTSLYLGDRLVCTSAILDGHLQWVSYARCCVDTTYSPDDEHGVARNM